MGFGELVLILVIVVVVFGATKLPQLGDGLGKAIKNFKRAVSSQNEIDVSPGAKEKKSELGDEPRRRPSRQSNAAERRPFWVRITQGFGASRRHCRKRAY
jgi:sec-independent protein translocase protein TatA